MTPSRKSVKC